MATGNVSAVNSDIWQLIETKTVSGGSSYSFTGLNGLYKKLMIVFDTTTGYSSYPCLQFNGDTDAKYAGGPFSGDFAGSSNREKYKIWLTASPAYDGQFNCVMIFNNTDQVAPKCAEFGVSNYASDISNAVYIGTSPITSVQAICAGGDNYGTGTLKLYGLVA